MNNPASVLAKIAALAFLFVPVCAKAQSETLLPFASFSTAGQVFQVAIEPDGQPVALVNSTARIPLPVDTIPLSYHADLPASPLLFGRERISGRLTIHALMAGQAAVFLTLSAEDAHNLYLHHAFVVDGRVFALIYDVANNTPSGRRVSGLSEGLDLVEFKRDGDAVTVLRHARALPLGGIDLSVFEVRQASGRRFFCTQSACLAVHLDPKTHVPVARLVAAPKAFPEGQQLLELAGDEQAIWGLIQRDVDDRFQPVVLAQGPWFKLCRLEAEPLDCHSIEGATLPFALSVRAGQPVYKTATSRADVMALFQYDLNRQRLSGMAHYGENNLEGRISWSQVYALQGYAAILSRSGLNSMLPAEFLAQIRLRACSEAQFGVSSAIWPYPWLMTKRYSLFREPIVSIAHVSRSYTTMRALESGGQCSIPTGFLRRAEQELQHPEMVLERFVPKPPPEASFEMRLRKYTPFWADGLNVPFNYTTAWLEAISLIPDGVETAPRQVAASMLSGVLIEIGISQRPKTWYYAGGDIAKGWSIADRMSSNTPAWAGDHQLSTKTAHISYRSMDALGISRAFRAGYAVPAGVVDHIRELVREGALYPFVLDATLDRQALPSLDLPQIMPYARSVLPWQIQNQAWVLAAYAARLPQ